MVELHVESFGVWRSMRTVPSVDHVSHLEGVTPSIWQATPCEKAVKLVEGGATWTDKG